MSDASSLTVVVACIVAAAIGFVVGVALTALIRRFARRRNLVIERGPLWQGPLTVLFVVLAVRGVLERADHEREWIKNLDYILGLVLIAIIAWLATVVVLTVQRAMLNRLPETRLEDRRSRHVRTKVTLVTRVLQALIVVVAVGAMLWTVPELRKVGIGLLASASVFAVILGIAAQTTLGNLFAGLQIAFTDAIRIDDIVVVEGKWGRIEDITLTYVTVRVWDNTTLILPCTYFTTTPFQNWTHKGTTVTGTVEIAVEWTAPLDALREELGRVLARSANAEEQEGDLFVDDATGPSMKLTAIVTATSGDAIAPLCREVREGLVTFLQDNHPGALPRGYEVASASPTDR